MNPKTHTPPQVKSVKNLHALLKQCFAVTSAAMLSACASVPERPTFPENCPREVVQAMRQAGLKIGTPFYMLLETRHHVDPEELREHPFPKVPVKTGPVIGSIDEHSTPNVFPDGTQFHGYLWTDADPELIFGRYTEAVLPDGRRIPICLMVTDDYTVQRGPIKGTRKRSESRPGAVLASPYITALLVERYDGL